MRLRFLLHLVPLLLPSSCVANAGPEPVPEAIAEAEPQTYQNNAPFSGAIYIVNGDGTGVTAAGANMCPSYASVSCSSMGSPSWCCPGSYVCANPANANGLIGCCPSGSTCAGSVNAAAITTVTVYAAQQTSVVYTQPEPTTVVVAAQPTTVAAYNPSGPYCSTQTMVGPGLPTARAGWCGTILIVNEGARNLKALGYGMGGFLVLIHLAIARMFHWL